MNCTEAKYLMPLYLSSELDAKAMAEFELHAQRCAACTREAEQIRLYDGLLRDGVVNLYWSWADGSGAPQRLTNSPNRQEPWSWHPSGKFLSYFEVLPNGKNQMGVLPMSCDGVSGWKSFWSFELR